MNELKGYYYSEDYENQKLEKTFAQYLAEHAKYDPEELQKYRQTKEEKKAREILSKAMNMYEAEQEFVKSIEYKTLPTEGDWSKERAIEQAEQQEENTATIEENESRAYNENENSVKQDAREDESIQELQKGYERIQKNAEFDAYIQTNVVHKSDKEVRHKVNLSI